MKVFNPNKVKPNKIVRINNNKAFPASVGLRDKSNVPLRSGGNNELNRKLAINTKPNDGINVATRKF